ncbi:LysR family transcriptional regulator [Burkholderia diffusa]|uniref:LysR family transcriptional regulator n=1 Tax=Burkholderia diffusa TaxID=488732 RepID=A0A6P2R846_9BURK|nr:LysR family transcriptional regulator [Burkholderia diffusa]
MRAASAGAFVTKFTVPGGNPVSCIASTMRPWVPPRGTVPSEHMQQVFAGHGLGLPNIVVETRSITVLKSLVARSGFLSWMLEPMYVTESKAGVFDTLELPKVVGQRTLTGFRRGRGLLPSPAVKLLEQLRQLTAEQR